MLTESAVRQTAQKLDRLADMLAERLFEPRGEVALLFYQVQEPLHVLPADELFGPAPERWGGEGAYGWFRGAYTVPEALDGQTLWLYPRIGGYEATLWVDGTIRGNYAQKELVGSHGNHYCDPICLAARAGQRIELALEYYAWHDVPGCAPFEESGQTEFIYPVGPVRVCTRNELYAGYLFDLRAVLGLWHALPEDSFRRAELTRALLALHRGLYYSPDDVSREVFDRALTDTRPLLQAELAKPAAASAPYVGLVGHSHMDTAWLWPLAETEKKCIRTFANQLALMELYPEYTFVQSSAYHSDILRRRAPELYERVRARVREGRYEMNGGVWVECDGNVTGGEAMVRQFVWGQRFTEKEFGVRSDAFWLPDTFGYSYAIPQIMAGCGVRYFLTTKIAWNETNEFPYTTFLWQGLDGTRVLTHFNRTHITPEPKSLLGETSDRSLYHDEIREKAVSDRRLFSFGKGDGGGGPEFESIEMARRLRAVDGLPRSEFTTVSRFMRELEQTAHEPTVYASELYLELHRGTLTNQHPIKRNNRLAELAMHRLELLTVCRAIARGEAADGESLRPLWNTLLVNQFHDILPGTGIRRVNRESVEQTTALLAEADARLTALAATASAAPDAVTLWNSASFDRMETALLPLLVGKRVQGHAQQRTETLDGAPALAVAGVRLPAFGTATLRLEDGAPEPTASPFRYTGGTLGTPFAHIRFGEGGALQSYVDKATGRELCDPAGYGLNALLIAEDVPAAWDNWDINADLMDKLAPTVRLLERRVVSDGPVELRIRSRYALTERSALTQDMVFYADTPRIDFDTLMDWQDDHRFLKAAFDTALRCESARSEIQFGCIQRSNHRGTSAEKARFEVCNHKYTDLSELNGGAAVLNDCKYGVSVEEGHIRLSLHKGGCRPDREGDHGAHRCRYAFLPHASGFSAEAVVYPAYAFNHPPVCWPGEVSLRAPLTIDVPGVLIETVKPCEDAEKAYIARLYEATGGYANATLRFGHAVHGLELTNMLEEPLEALETADDGAGATARLAFRPFEIKTLRVRYA